MAKTTDNTGDRVVREPSDANDLEREGRDAAGKAEDKRPAGYDGSGDPDAGRTPDTLPKQ